MSKHLRLVELAAVLILCTSACAPQPTATSQPTQAPPGPSPVEITSAVVLPGSSDRTILVGEQTRAYILYIPAGYDGSKALPLVLMLHGYSDSAANMVAWSGMNAKADQENFIVAYLSGTGSPRAWNTGIIPGLASGVDDVAFARTVIETLEAELRIDPRRVYAAGSSQGAMMTYRLAAELSDRLAAVAAQAGTVGTKDRGGTIRTAPTSGGPVSIVSFHGKADPTIPYDGGEGDAGARLSWFPVTDSIAFSLKQNGCVGSPQVTTSADGNIIQEDYTDCRDGSEVLLYTIVSGNHYWPNLADDGLSATDAIWEFFSRHARRD